MFLVRCFREAQRKSTREDYIFFAFFFFQGHGNSQSNWIPGRPRATGPVATSQLPFQVSGIKQPLTLSYRINGGTQEPGTACRFRPRLDWETWRAVKAEVGFDGTSRLSMQLR